MPNLYLADDIEMKKSENDEMSEESDVEKYKKLFTPPKVQKQKNTLAIMKQSKKNLKVNIDSKQNSEVVSNDDSFRSDEDLKNEEDVFQAQQ